MKIGSISFSSSSDTDQSHRPLDAALLALILQLTLLRALRVLDLISQAKRMMQIIVSRSSSSKEDLH